MSIVYADELLKHGCITQVIPKRYTEFALKGDIKVGPGPSFKPAGVWLSWDNGWQRWCKSEEFLDIEDYDQVNVELTPLMKFWLIDDMEDFLEMWNQYYINYKPSDVLETEFANSLLVLMKAEQQFKVSFWDWLRDVKKLNGIALTDKGQWATRMRTFFYGWDCSTVFLFRPKGIKMSRQKLLMRLKQ